MACTVDGAGHAEGLDGWKNNPVSRNYQHKLIQQRLINLRAWRKAGDWPQLIFSLREGLHRNLGNLANPGCTSIRTSAPSC
ncbi:MAG: DUF3336 domain-containing protein [Comamonadaceae bacterium]|nr:DUF3336 domain-containing protein [Comamonadaceae bacterium]